MEGGNILKAYTGLTVFTNDPRYPLIEDAYILVDDGQIIEVEKKEGIVFPEDVAIEDLDGCVAFPLLSNSYIDLSVPLKVWLSESFRGDAILENYKSAVLNGREYWLNEMERLSEAIENTIERLLSLGMGNATFALPFTIDDPSEVLSRFESYPIKVIAGPVITTEEVEEDILKSFSENDCPLFIVLDETFYEKHRLLSHYEATGTFYYIIPDFSRLEEVFIKTEGRRVIEIFRESNIFTGNSVIVHGWGLTDIELDVLAVRNVLVIKTPRFELLVHGGTLSLSEYIGRGMNVHLGTGPFSPNIFKEIESTLLFYRHTLRSTAPLKILQELIIKLVFSEGLVPKKETNISKRLMKGFEASFAVATPAKKIKNLEELVLFLMEDFREETLRLTINEGEEIWKNPFGHS